eukprot:9224952-Alexandrium_andersonii.AAC.1
MARAAFPPSPARGQSAGTCPSDSRVPWTSKGGSPGAEPHGPRPRKCRATFAGPHTIFLQSALDRCRSGPALAPAGPRPGALEGVWHLLGCTASKRRPAARGGRGRRRSCPTLG